MVALEFINICKTYNNKTKALDNLSFTVKPGIIYGLLGPNGAGKSTSINIIAGLLLGDSGTIKIFGQDIRNNYTYKKDVGFVLSRPLYFDKLTVYEFLDFVCAMYSLRKNISNERIIELLEFFELDDKKHEQIKNLSTGMKKKVSLVSAMLHKPKLLILDEPLEGLDPYSANKIKESFRIMKNNGMSIVITSHVLDTIEKYSDEVGIIDNGKMIFQSATDDIRNTIKNELTQETYNSLEELFIDLTSIENEKDKFPSWL